MSHSDRHLVSERRPEPEARSGTRVVTRHGRDVRLQRACRLEVLEGPDAGLQLRAQAPQFRIGSEEGNDLLLSDPTVSKHHLELCATPEGHRLTDLGSSNGTFLGSSRVGELTVVEAVTLRLGATTLRIEPTDDEVELPASPNARFGGVLGRAPVMRELFLKLEALAGSDCSVLLEGETGVGKELVAESLHAESPRRRGPFVVVDCGALSGDLMEAQLFGHVRGAFTGADSARRGLLESAQGGTVFLDEVGELPLPLQAKLLGALERRRVTPLGAQSARAIDVRVIAATHRDLARESNQGRFRSDLYYRLAVVRLRVPPLRERLEDVPLLVESFLAALRGRAPELPPQLSALALQRLQQRPWPGNVRELRNAVERAAFQLPELEPERDRRASSPEAFFAARDRAVEDFERRYFGELLEATQHNLSQAARLALLDRRYLHRILRRLGLHST